MLRHRLPGQIPPRENTARVEAGSRWLRSTPAKGSDEMTDELITRLAAANPVPHDGRLHFAEPVRSRTTRKAVLVAAVVVIALAGTSVAIANRLGAFDGGVFNGISAAHHPR